MRNYECEKRITILSLQTGAFQARVQRTITPEQLPIVVAMFFPSLTFFLHASLPEGKTRKIA